VFVASSARICTPANAAVCVGPLWGARVCVGHARVFARPGMRMGGAAFAANTRNLEAGEIAKAVHELLKYIYDPVSNAGGQVYEIANKIFKSVKEKYQAFFNRLHASEVEAAVLAGDSTKAMELKLHSRCVSSLCCVVLCCAVLCCVVLCCVVLCCVVLCCVVLCCVVLCCVVLCCAVLCCAVLCCAVLCCAVLCCAVLCCAVLCCAVTHCVVLVCVASHVSPGRSMCAHHGTIRSIISPLSPCGCAP
jgi:hypothetical protein